MKPTIETTRRVLALAAMAALAVMTLAASASASEFEIVTSSFTVDNQVNFSSTVIMQKASVAPGNPNNVTTWGAGNAGGLYFDGSYKVWEPGSGAWVMLSTVAAGGTQVTGSGTQNYLPMWGAGNTLGNGPLVKDGAASVTVLGSSLTVQGAMNAQGSLSISGANSVLTSSGVAAAAGQAGVFFSTSVFVPRVSTVTAGYFIGDGSGLSNISGSLSGGTANAVPYWTGATTQGNSQMIRDSANSFTVGNSSLTLNGANGALEIKGSAASALTVSASGNVTLNPTGAGAAVSISPTDAASSVTINPGGGAATGLKVTAAGGTTIVSRADGTNLFKIK